MTEEEQAKMKEAIEEAIRPKLKKEFTKGCVAGFNAGIATCYELIKNMTSAKAIKETLKTKLNESEEKLGINLENIGDAQP